MFKVSFLSACVFCQTVFVVVRCVGAQADMLHDVSFRRGYAALLILLKHWRFTFIFRFVCCRRVGFIRVAYKRPIPAMQSG